MGAGKRNANSPSRNVPFYRGERNPFLSTQLQTKGRPLAPQLRANPQMATSFEDLVGGRRQQLSINCRPAKVPTRLYSAISH